MLYPFVMWAVLSGPTGLRVASRNPGDFFYLFRRHVNEREDAMIALAPRENDRAGIGCPARIFAADQLRHLSSLRWHHANLKPPHHCREDNPFAVRRPV